jgi:hypothetical protein
MTTVVGGVYAERCLEPYWDDVYGSGGRAAAAISAAVPDVRLVTYRAEDLADGLENLAAIYSLEIGGDVVPNGIGFDYMHSLADPRITPRPDAIPQHPQLSVEDEVVLRFGMLEGTARVTARRAVYDPQSAFDPRPFAENGSSADELALILNRLEGRRLTGESEPESMIEALLRSQGVDLVVLKLGGHGALVATGATRTIVPAYKSKTVWKIGSGDVFSGAFTQFWAVEGRAAGEAADLASRAVSRYAETRALPIPSAQELVALNTEAVRPGNGYVYIAAPFFNLGELWMVEEVRKRLMDMGVGVFSPLHDVGRGPATDVARKDLEGLDRCGAVLAVLNGGDAGTIFEVGYAVAREIPVVALAQNVRSEDLKMPEGAGCHIAEDLVTAIYQAVWSLR